MGRKFLHIGSPSRLMAPVIHRPAGQISNASTRKRPARALSHANSVKSRLRDSEPEDRACKLNFYSTADLLAYSEAVSFLTKREDLSTYNQVQSLLAN